MSDRDDQVSANRPSRVTPLPTPLAQHLEYVGNLLQKSDAALSENNAVECLEESTIQEGGRAEFQRADQDPIDQVKTQDASEAIFEALIGLGLMLVGLATMVAVAFLPWRKLTPVFLGAALTLLGGGAWRFDRATRPHRMAKRRGRSVKRNA